MFRGTPTIPPEKYRADHDARPARATTPTPATTTRTTTPRSPRRTWRRAARARGRPVPEPRLLGGGLQDRSAGGARRVQQEQRRPDPRSSSRCSASASSRPTPTSTRRWASSATSRTCRTSTSTRRCSSSAGTARRTRRVIVAGDVTPEQVLPLVEKYWGGWKAGDAAPVADPAGARAERARCTRTCPGRATRCPGSRSRFPRPRSRDRARTRRPSTCWPRCTSAPTSELYKRLVVDEQKVDELDVDVPRQRRSVAVHRARAREEPGRRRLRARPDPGDVRGRPLGRWRRRQRLADAKSNARYAFARTLDNTERIADLVAAYASLPALVRHAERLLPDARLAHAGGPAGGRAEVLHRRRPDRDDAVERAAARRDSARAGAQLGQAGSRVRAGLQPAPPRRS